MSQFDKDVEDFVNAYAKLTPLRHKIHKDLLAGPKYQKYQGYDGPSEPGCIWASIISESSKDADLVANPWDNLNDGLLSDLNMLNLVHNPRLKQKLNK